MSKLRYKDEKVLQVSGYILYNEEDYSLTITEPQKGIMFSLTQANVKDVLYFNELIGNIDLVDDTLDFIADSEPLNDLTN